MDRESIRDTIRWSSGVSALAGIWLMVAPFVLGYENLLGPFWNAVIVGGAIAVIGLARVAAPLHHHPGLGWLHAAFGVWLVVAPFILGYTPGGEEIAAGAAVGADGTVVTVATEVASWNEAIVGMTVVILAARSATAGGRAAPLPASPNRAASGQSD